MKIEFSWPPTTPDKSAEALAGKISTRTGLPLRVGTAYRRERQALILEIPGLSDRYHYATLSGDGRIHETDYCATVAGIEMALIALGVNVEIFVGDGFSLRQYATQQEKLARRRKQAIEDAIAMLKKTRKIFGKKIFQEIRQRLEQDLADPTY